MNIANNNQLKDNSAMLVTRSWWTQQKERKKVCSQTATLYSSERDNIASCWVHLHQRSNKGPPAGILIMIMTERWSTLLLASFPQWSHCFVHLDDGEEKQLSCASPPPTPPPPPSPLIMAEQNWLHRSTCYLCRSKTKNLTPNAFQKCKKMVKLIHPPPPPPNKTPKEPKAMLLVEPWCRDFHVITKKIYKNVWMKWLRLFVLASKYQSLNWAKLH